MKAVADPPFTASEMALKRWKGIPKRARRAHALKMVAARRAKAKQLAEAKA